MKTNRHLHSGSLREDPRVLATYADYFVKFIRAYAQHGIRIDVISPQNEPAWTDLNYPTCSISPQLETAFVKVLGRRFVQEGIKTKIIVWDHNWDWTDYPIQVLSDKEANPFIDGTGFHAYGGGVERQAKVHDAFPDKNIYFTEASSGQWSADFIGNVLWDAKTLHIGATRYWSRTVFKWNIALDGAGGPKCFGGGPWCRGLVKIDDDGKVSRNSDYYGLAHGSRFVQVGARRIESSHPDSGAFLNPDGSVVLIVCNSHWTDRPGAIRWAGQSVLMHLPAKSVTTFTWDGHSDAVASWITAGDRKQLLERQPNLFFVKR